MAQIQRLKQHFIVYRVCFSFILTTSDFRLYQLFVMLYRIHPTAGGSSPWQRDGWRGRHPVQPDRELVLKAGN